MIIEAIMDRIYAKVPTSREMAAIDISDFPYKLEQKFTNWLHSFVGISHLEPERVARRLAVAQYSEDGDFKFSAGAESYVEKRTESSLLGLETITFELNPEGKNLIGELPLDINLDINSGIASKVLLKSRVKRQLRNVGYDADRTAKTQIVLAELRKHGYLTPKFNQTIEIGVYIDKEMEIMKVLGEIHKVTYIIDLEDQNFIKALAKVTASSEAEQKAPHLELVEG